MLANLLDSAIERETPAEVAVEDLRRGRCAASVWPTAVTTRVVSDAVTTETGPQLLCETLRLWGVVGPQVRRRLPLGLTELREVLIAHMPVDPTGRSAQRLARRDQAADEGAPRCVEVSEDRRIRQMLAARNREPDLDHALLVRAHLMGAGVIVDGPEAISEVSLQA